MLIHAHLGLLINTVYVSALIFEDPRFYVRIARDREQNSFNMLEPAQFDYDNTYYGPEQEHHSFKFMEAPVKISNPLFNMVSKVSDFYNWMSRYK